jgi:hypothetical protein
LTALLSSNAVIQVLPSKRKCTSIAADCPDPGTFIPDYAQYGVTSRTLHFRTGELKNCMVLCKAWPSWFWAARARGFHVALVLLSDVTWMGLIKHISPSTEVIEWKSFQDVQFPVVEGIFSDYNLKGTLTPILNYVTKFVVTIKAMQNPPNNWAHCKLQVKHHLCGGVTDGAWVVHLYVKAVIQDKLEVPRQAQRDLSCIVDSMVTRGTPCAPPKSLQENKEPCVVELRPGTYHGRGLIPWKLKDVRAVVPSVFSPTKWIRRALTDKEKLLAWDVSHEILNYLPDRSLGKSLQMESLCLPNVVQQ